MERNGIAFRQPRGRTGEAPYLTLWVWLTEGEAPRGSDVATRAAGAFHRNGHALFQRLLGRPPIFGDPRVGGYGLVLTWLGPATRGGRLVGESLAVFADKLAVANFVFDTIAPSAFLERAGVRIFDGQTEVNVSRLPLDDAAPPLDRPPC